MAEPEMDCPQSDVVFNSPVNAEAVRDLMREGLRFQEAIDQLELRLNEHFIVTRNDQRPEGEWTE